MSAEEGISNRAEMKVTVERAEEEGEKSKRMKRTTKGMDGRDMVPTKE